MAMGTFFLGFPIYGLFTPGFYKGSSAPETAGTLLLGVLVALVCAWAGIRQFRNGARVNGGRLTIRNELRTYTVDAADIDAISLQPKSNPNGDHWVARVELTSGKSIWIDNFDCGSTGKPPKPGGAAAVEEIRALLRVRADGIRQPETQAADVTACEDGLDETQARINHREAIIRKSLKCTKAIICLFAIIVIPDPATGETDQNLPTWLWWGVGVAAVMLALIVLALRANAPRRIAEIITTNSNELDVQ